MIDVPKIRELLGRVPQPPEEAIPNGVSESAMKDFEERTGIPLPEEVRAWLKIANGPCVGPGGIFGIRPERSHLDIEACLEMFPSWKARKWIPVAGDGCGNYYVVPTQQEYGNGYPVVFIDTISSPDTPAYVVASDMGHFLVALLEQELGARNWPFNKNHVTHADPDIVNSKGVSPPWAAAETAIRNPNND